MPEPLVEEILKVFIWLVKIEDSFVFEIRVVICFDGLNIYL